MQSHTLDWQIAILTKDALVASELKSASLDLGVTSKNVSLFSDPRALSRHLRTAAARFVFVDVDVWDESGGTLAQEELARLCARASTGKIIVLSQQNSITASHQALSAGAHAFYCKNTPMGDLMRELPSLATTGSMEQSDFVLKEIDSSPCAFGLVGHSAQLNVLRGEVSALATENRPVLLIGEKGSGKQAFAQAIHASSSAKNQDLRILSLGAQRADFNDEALFKPEQSETIIVRHVENLTPQIQERLAKQFSLSSPKTPENASDHPFGPKLIFTTRANLLNLVERGKFREDLFFLLSHSARHIPPLRQRPDDLEPLCAHFVTQFNAEFSKNIAKISADAMAMLRSNKWTDNFLGVRQAIWAAAQNCQSETIQVCDLPDLSSKSNGQVSPAHRLAKSKKSDEITPMWLEEKRIIERALIKFDGNTTLAAQALQISPSTIYRKRLQWQKLTTELGHSAA